jgi:hypothetical protein
LGARDTNTDGRKDRPVEEQMDRRTDRHAEGRTEGPGRQTDPQVPHRQQVPLVDELPLAVLQLRAQAPQLALVAPQQRELV